MLMDEFYSHYVWNDGPPLMSAAQYVEDVDKDPIVVFDGLTKNWRYPGFRISWTVGPKKVIEAVASAGSFLDGGGSRPMQLAARDLLTVEHAQQEAEALRRTFGRKRSRLLDGLRAIGVRFEREPGGTFYAWGNLAGLPEGLRTGHELFRAALTKKVIVVPGQFFDIDPGRRRFGRVSRFINYARFSFGPEESVLDRAVERLAGVVAERT